MSKYAHRIWKEENNKDETRELDILKNRIIE